MEFYAPEIRLGAETALERRLRSAGLTPGRRKGAKPTGVTGDPPFGKESGAGRRVVRIEPRMQLGSRRSNMNTTRNNSERTQSSRALRFK